MTEIYQLRNRTVISDRRFGELLASNKALNDKAASRSQCKGDPFHCGKSSHKGQASKDGHVAIPIKREPDNQIIHLFFGSRDGA